MMSLKAVFFEAVKASRKKNPFWFNPDLGQAGFRPSDTLGKTHSKDGSYTTSGSGYTTIGLPGWSRASKEFDLPENADEDEVEIPGEKDPPVAYGPPKFIGGSSMPLMKGFRRK